MAPKTDTLGTIWHVPDELWKRLAPILGPDKPAGTVGRPARPSRLIFDALL